MIRIDDYEQLKTRIVNWIKDYYWKYNIKALVVGVSGGIDSAVVSTLCAETGLPTYVLTMPLHSKEGNTELSDAHAHQLVEKYSNVTLVNVDLTETYDKFMYCVDDTFSINQLANANTKSRLRMVTLYQVAGSVGGIVVGTGNKVEDYGIGFYTKYGDGGVDISPIADCMKTDVWKMAAHLHILQDIQDASPSDGLWDDGRTDEDQIGMSYFDLEKAMTQDDMGAIVTIPEEARKLETYRKMKHQNEHKMKPIPVCSMEKFR